MVCAYCSSQGGGGVNPDPSVISSNTDENSSISLNTEHIEVSLFEIDEEGFGMNAFSMEKWNMGEGTEVKCLMLPGYMVITNLPHKLKTLDAIEELLYRQDELKNDFSLPILQLTQMV